MTYTLQLNSRGQITLPAELRRRLGLQPGSRIQVHSVEKKLILEPEEHEFGPVTQSLRRLFLKSKVTAADWELIHKWRSEDMEGLDE